MKHFTPRILASLHGPGGNSCVRQRMQALLSIATLLMVLLAAMLAGGGAAQAAMDKLFAVDAIAVDETADDATQAKMRAIVKAQRQAFLAIVRRLAGEQAAQRLAKLSDRDIGRMLSSLSIADERTGPRRYIAKISIRFSPRKVTKLLRRKGIAFITRQAPPVLVIPVWEGEQGPVLWQDNPWLKAWRKLADENALVPVLVPVGDEVDAGAITAEQAMQGEEEALQALRMRYGAEYALVAIARPVDERTVQAAMVGRSPGGKLLFDKTYTAEEGGLDAAAEQGTRRFIEVMTLKWRQKLLKELARERAERAAAQRAAQARRLTVIVPFRSLREWQQLRARISTTPGIRGVDVEALSGNHAVVRLATSLSTEALRQALGNSGLLLRSSGGRWYLQSY